MNQMLFPQNVIALIWDFDKTLTPEYMQKPLFEKYGVDAEEFWREVNGLTDFYKRQGVTKVSKDVLYLTHILTYVRKGVFKDLSNDDLLHLGKQIEFYNGLPLFFQTIKSVIEDDKRFMRDGITVEHYIVSTGLRQMILGSAIAPYVDYTWACEFIEEHAPPGYLHQDNVSDEPQQIELIKAPAPQPRSKKPIRDIGYFIDNTTKTRAVFELNKGVNKYPEIDVNAKLALSDRRVPFQNMIYVADGPSDVPVFSVVRASGGKTYAVYNPKSEKEFAQAKLLNDQGRVDAFGPADYTAESHSYKWIMASAVEIAERISKDRAAALGERLGSVPSHIIEKASKDILSAAPPQALPESGAAVGAPMLPAANGGLPA